MGFALLQQSNDPTAAKIILYRTKSQILSTALLPLLPQKSLTYKQDYLQYTDDATTFWSLHFASSDEANVFLQELEKRCALTRENATEIAAEAIKIETELSEAAAETDTDTASSRAGDDASKKSNIVMRMAKVGQALPMLNAASAQSNANDLNSSMSSNGTDDHHSSLVLSSAPALPLSKPANISVAVQPMPNYWQSSSSIASTNLSNFVTENRVQNAEVRMNMSKLESKLDRVLDKIEIFNLGAGRSAGRNTDFEEEIIKLEEKMVELKKENRLLKMKIAQAESNEAPMNASPSDNFKEELETIKEDAKALRQEDTNKAIKIQELEEKLKLEGEKLTVSMRAKAELEKKVRDLEEKLKTEGRLKSTLAQDADKRDAEILDLTMKVATMTAKIAEHEQNNKDAQVKANETIRSIMNKLYSELFQNVNGRETFTSAEVLKLTAELIRRETKAALNQTI